MRLTSFLLAGLASGLLVISANGAVFNQLSDPLDREYTSDNVTSNGVGNDLRVGVRVIDTSIASGIFFFALPAIPAGETVTTATFTVELNATAGTSTPASDANVDLYGLPFDPQPLTTPANNDAIIAERYFTGANDTRYPKLQEDFFVPADAGAAVNRKTSLDISSYIKGLYDAGAVAGDFVVLRLSYDDATLDTTTTNRYRFRSGDTAVTEADRPVLTIVTAVPEPNAVGLALLVGAGMLIRRRRR